jgi:hypothetical protein
MALCQKLELAMPHRLELGVTLINELLDITPKSIEREMMRGSLSREQEMTGARRAAG